MELRRITSCEDIEIVKSFFYQIFEDELENDLSCFERSISERHNRGRLEYYLGYEDGEVVGVSGVYADNDDECWLGWFGVRPEYRRRGYATAILDLQLEMMKEYGYKVCRLYTDSVVNKNAIELYLKKGFLRDSLYEENIITMMKLLDEKAKPEKWVGVPLGF